MNKVIITLQLILTSSVYAFSDEHDFQLAVPFTDNMILQRGVKVPVWGQDISGSEITVKFSGQTKKAIADRQGDWMVKLDPLKASLNEQLMEVSTALTSGRSNEAATKATFAGPRFLEPKSIFSSPVVSVYVLGRARLP